VGAVQLPLWITIMPDVAQLLKSFPAPGFPAFRPPAKKSQRHPGSVLRSPEA